MCADDTTLCYNIDSISEEDLLLPIGCKKLSFKVNKKKYKIFHKNRKNALYPDLTITLLNTIEDI